MERGGMGKILKTEKKNEREKEKGQKGSKRWGK